MSCEDENSTSHGDEKKKNVLFKACHAGMSGYLPAHLNGTLCGDNHENNSNYYDMIYEGNLITRKTVEDGKNSNTGMRLFGRYQKTYHSCNTLKMMDVINLLRASFFFFFKSLTFFQCI